MHTSGLGHLCKLCGCRRISSLRCVLHSIITPELSSWTVSQPGCRINLAALTSARPLCGDARSHWPAALKIWQTSSSTPLSLATVHLSQQEEWQEMVPDPPVQARGRLHTTAWGAGSVCLSVGLYSSVPARASKGRTSFCPTTWPGDCSAVACEHHLEMHTIRTSISVCFALTESWTDTLQKHFLP